MEDIRQKLTHDKPKTVRNFYMSTNALKSQIIKSEAMTINNFYPKPY